MKNNAGNDPECCPPFQPELWDDQLFEWDQKKFIRDKVCTLFYMPLNFGQVMKRLDKTMRASGVTMSDAICLSDHTSMWNMDIYLAVDKAVPGSANTTLSGRYFCKVYEGPFRDTGKWCKDIESIAKSKGYKTGKLLMWYTTCPKCAKKYGRNYVAIFLKLG